MVLVVGEEVDDGMIFVSGLSSQSKISSLAV